MSTAEVRCIEELPGFEPAAPGVPGVPGEEAIRAYERDGVVCLRGAFSAAWVERGRRAVAAALRARRRSEQHSS